MQITTLQAHRLLTLLPQEKLLGLLGDIDQLTDDKVTSAFSADDVAEISKVLNEDGGSVGLDQGMHELTNYCRSLRQAHADFDTKGLFEQIVKELHFGILIHDLFPNEEVKQDTLTSLAKTSLVGYDLPHPEIYGSGAVLKAFLKTLDPDSRAKFNRSVLNNAELFKDLISNPYHSENALKVAQFVMSIPYFKNEAEQRSLEGKIKFIYTMNVALAAILEDPPVPQPSPESNEQNKFIPWIVGLAGAVIGLGGYIFSGEKVKGFLSGIGALSLVGTVVAAIKRAGVEGDKALGWLDGKGSWITGIGGAVLAGIPFLMSQEKVKGSITPIGLGIIGGVLAWFSQTARSAFGLPTEPAELATQTTPEVKP